MEVSKVSEGNFQNDDTSGKQNLWKARKMGK